MKSIARAFAARDAVCRHRARRACPCRARDWPNPLFHRQRPVQPRGRDRSADQPRRPHHRLCAQVERHHDRQSAPDDLAGRRRDRAAAPAPRRLRFLFLAALVARRHAASPTSQRKAAARSSTSAGWQAAKARASPACPTARAAIAWSPDGRRIAYTMFVPDDGPKLGKAPDKPEGAKWADPLQVIDAVTYRTDDDGYLKPGYYQIFWVPADGGAPTQLTFGATHAGGRSHWTPDGRSILFSADLSKNWEREPVEQRDLSPQHRRRRAGRADQPRRSRQCADGLARRPPHRLMSASTTASSATRTRSCRS